jgi:hypothetical protein
MGWSLRLYAVSYEENVDVNIAQLEFLEFRPMNPDRWKTRLFRFLTRKVDM